jgi:hypothetical protein
MAILLAAVAAGVWLGSSVARTRFAPSTEMAAAFSERDLFTRLREGLDCIGGQGAAGCADLAMMIEKREIAARLGAPELFRAVLYRWGQCDPRGALAFLRTTRYTDALALSHAAILHGWLDTDARAALAWCRSHPLPEFSCEAEDLPRLERRWRTAAEFNLEAAERSLEAGMPHTSFRGVSPFLRVLRPPEDTPWLRKTAKGRDPNGDYGMVFEQRWAALLLTWAENEPLVVYRWLVRTQNLPVGREAPIQMLLEQWFRTDPARVADLVVYENDGNRWLDGFREGFALWASRDPEAMLAWIQKLPPRIADDRFRMRRANVAGVVNPDLALEIALGIGDAELRTEIIEDCVSSCRKRFPSFFPEWLKKHESAIPASARRRVEW